MFCASKACLLDDKYLEDSQLGQHPCCIVKKKIIIMTKTCLDLFCNAGGTWKPGCHDEGCVAAQSVLCEDGGRMRIFRRQPTSSIPGPSPGHRPACRSGGIAAGVECIQGGISYSYIYSPSANKFGQSESQNTGNLII